MNREPNNSWGRWADRFLSWGTLATVVAVALVGLALLATARHPARHEAGGSSSVLMANPIDSAHPSVELHKPGTADPKTCADQSRPQGAAACQAQAGDTPNH